MVANSLSKPCTAFEGSRLLTAGPLLDVAVAVKNALDQDAAKPILVFDDLTGRVVDLDMRGTNAEMIERLVVKTAEPASKSRARRARSDSDADPPRTRGRPRLGVVPREVTLLPRHWEWLAAQPGGASATLRRLAEEARRAGGAEQKTRAAREAAYKFMEAMAGDHPGFEEGIRALFADDRPRLERHIASWPEDVREHALKLAFAARSNPDPAGCQETEGES